MRFLKLLLFTLRHQARAAHWQAGAEFVGGDTLRARALSHSRLRTLGAEAMRAELAEMRLPSASAETENVQPTHR